MPLPIAHSLAGFSLYFWGQELRFFENCYLTILFFVFIACLPDADFLPGYFLGNPNLYHTLWTHTLGAALIVTSFTAWLFARKYGMFWRYFALLFALYYSHVVLDFFNNDTRFPYGIMAFWPLSSTFFMSPLPVFESIEKSSDAGNFIASIMVMHNFTAAVKEFLVMTPVVGLSFFLKRSQVKRSEEVSLKSPP